MIKLISKLASIFSARDTVPIPSTSENEPSVNRSFIVQMLVSVLRSQGYDPAEDNGGVSLPSGIRLEVELLEVVELNPQGFRASSMIRAVHGTYFPSGLAEFQHTVGKSVDHALSEGFSLWAKMDLVTLEDAVREKPENSTVIEMGLPSDSTQAGLVRQIILGPVGHFVSQSTPSNEEHPFCPCCLLTKNFEAFRPLIARDDVLGIRFFVSRNQNGEVADCRVNGDAFEPAVTQLIEYAKTWPDQGLEYRKQYVVMRTVNPAAAIGSESLELPHTL